jgi:cytochrome c-type biogenesis protein CcmH/NrfF
VADFTIVNKMHSSTVRRIFCVLFICITVAAYSAEPAKDVQLEQRVNAVAAELRCLVCQNQSLADSNADLAVDLKNQIREKMRDGASEADIVAYMVARYGDFVLYRPPVKLTTVLLWGGPFVLMVLGLLLLVRRLRERGRGAAEAPLTQADHARAAALLADTEVQGEAARGDKR